VESRPLAGRNPASGRSRRRGHPDHRVYQRWRRRRLL